MDRDAAVSFRCPRWGELPGLPLYMDQVVLVLEEALLPLAGAKERVVTPSMVNNYVKHGLVRPPEKKKYGRPQLAALVVVSVLKRALTMNEIAALVELTNQAYGSEGAYDLFCQELESMLRAAFGADGSVTWRAAGESPVGEAMSAALMALMGKLLLQSRLACAEDGRGG